MSFTKIDEKNHYKVVLKNGIEERFASLSDIVSKVPDDLIECILEAEFQYTYYGTSNKADWFHYSLVSADGSKTTYRIGDFEVAYIGNDNGYIKFFGRDITIKMISTGLVFPYRSKAESYFIFNEIRPLLTELNKLSSIDSVIEVFNKQLSGYDLLKHENDKLKNTISEIKNLIESMNNVNP